MATSWPVTERGLRDAAIQNLYSIAAARTNAVTRLLLDVQRETIAAAQRDEVRDAVRRLTSSFRRMDQTQRDGVREAYTVKSPFPAGSREALDDGNDDSAYSQLHREIHPRMRNWAQLNRLRDVMLVNEIGDVVYSLAKENDFATNLLTGPYANSGAAEAYRTAMAKTSMAEAAFVDYSFYESSRNGPSAFSAARVTVGPNQTLGAIVVQIGVEPINQIMSDSAGLGETGDAYLVGGDFFLRSDSRFSKSASLVERAENVITKAALSASETHLFAKDRHGRDVLAVVMPIQVLGLHWGLVVKAEVREVFSALRESQLLAIQSGLIAILVTGLLGWLVARSLTRPLHQLTRATETLSSGDLRAEIPFAERVDEIGAMARALTIFRAEMQRANELGAAVKESEARLMNLLNLTPIGVIVQSFSGVVHFANNSAIEMLARKQEEVIGSKMARLVTPVHSDRWQEFLNDVTRKGNAEERDLEFLIVSNQRNLMASISASQIDYAGETCMISFVSDVTEQRISERALAAEQRKSTALFEGAPEATVIVDETGKIVLFNARAEEVFGYARAEVIGKGVETLIPERMHGRHHGLREQYTTNPRPREMGRNRVLTAIRRDGHEFPVEISLSPVAGEKLVSATVRDISERLKAESELRTFEFTLRNAAEGIVLIDRGGNITFANDKFCEMTNVSADLMGNQTVEDFLTDPANLSWSKRWKMLRAYEKALTDERQLLVHESSPMPCEVTSRYMKFGGDEFVCAFVRDITERKQAEQAVAKSKAELQAVLDNSPAIIYMKDIGGRYLFVNRAWAELFRVSGDMARGRLDVELFEPDAAATLAGADRSVAESGRMLTAEVPAAVEGDDRSYYAARFPLRDENGAIYATCGILTDITERKKSEAEMLRAKEAAEEATRAKSSFLAMMSHEIRTPMNGVMSMAEMLDSTNLDDDQRDISRVIRTSAEALLTIINDILDFSKIEAGKFDLEEIPFNPTAIIEGVGDLMAQRAYDKNIRLYVEVDPTIPSSLLGDPNRLRQVVLNLVGNAVKFTDKGHVFLRARRLAAREGDRATVRIEVIDTGVGLTEDQLGKLFQAFQQADISTSRRFGGTGLGLTISKRIIEMMGGKIGATSIFSEGSTFWAEVPFAIADAKVEVPPADVSELGVVTIGFDETGNGIVSRYLTAARVQHLAEAGHHDIEQALRDMSARVKNVVALLNLRDSVIAVEALKRLRDVGIPSLRIIVFTPRSMISTMGHAKGAGADAVLPLPIPRQLLWRSLAFVVGLVPTLGDHEERSVTDAEWVAPPIETAREAGALILVAEDNKTNQHVIKRILSRMGYAFEMANDGVEALDMYKSGRYGMLLSDYHMPRMDGFALTTAIREMEAESGKHLPIIALTADAMASTEQHCLAAGMDGFLTKPISVPALRTTLEKWLPAATGLRRRPSDATQERAGSVEAADDRDRRVAMPVNEIAAGSSVGAGDAFANLPDFDIAQIEDAFGSFDADARELVQGFLQDLDLRITEITETLEAGRIAEARGIAHALKGSSRSLGARRLGAVAADMQTLLESNELDRARALLPALTAAGQSLRSAIRNL